MKIKCSDCIYNGGPVVSEDGDYCRLTMTKTFTNDQSPCRMFVSLDAAFRAIENMRNGK